MRLILAFALTTLALSACAGNGLRQLNSTQRGPDEFIIEPKKPLEQPGSYSELPVPTPGQANLTDKFPLQEAVIAVGGRPQSAAGGIPASDGALVQAASRLGVAPDIRATLAEEDEAFRKRRGRFTGIRIVPVDSYSEVYKREALQPRSVADRWRRAGARTPSYPPKK